MAKKFKTPNISCQNVITFTCSDDSVNMFVELFSKLKGLGEQGRTTDVTIYWDGDGNNRLENISVNGLSLENWDKEFERLKK